MQSPYMPKGRDGEDAELRPLLGSRLHSCDARGSSAPHVSDVPYWAHELSYSSLASNDSEYTQQPWLPDGVASHCMLCKRPFHLLRWTHHCRDCGGLYCLACSSHRVETDVQKTSQSAALRLCDSCAFSPHHPRHIGCDNPFACSRCGPPTSPGELLVYLQLFIRLILCCGTTESCMCFGAGCIAALDQHAAPAARGAGFDNVAAAKRRS